MAAQTFLEVVFEQLGPVELESVRRALGKTVKGWMARFALSPEDAFSEAVVLFGRLPDATQQTLIRHFLAADNCEAYLVRVCFYQLRDRASNTGRTKSLRGQLDKAWKKFTAQLSFGGAASAPPDRVKLTAEFTNVAERVFREASRNARQESEAKKFQLVLGLLRQHVEMHINSKTDLDAVRTCFVEALCEVASRDFAVVLPHTKLVESRPGGKQEAGSDGEVDLREVAEGRVKIVSEDPRMAAATTGPSAHRDVVVSGALDIASFYSNISPDDAHRLGHLWLGEWWRQFEAFFCSDQILDSKELEKGRYQQDRAAWKRWERVEKNLLPAFPEAGGIFRAVLLRLNQHFIVGFEGKGSKQLPDHILVEVTGFIKGHHPLKSSGTYFKAYLLCTYTAAGGNRNEWIELYL